MMGKKNERKETGEADPVPGDVAGNDWTVSYQKAQAMVDKMTLEEKVCVLIA